MARGKGLDYGNFFEKLNAKTQKDDENQEEKEKDHQVNDDPEEIEEEIELESEPESEKDNLETDDDYLNELTEKKKSETHRQETFRVEKALLKELNKMYRKYGYGFKTKFINSAIRRELERIKKLEKKRKQS